MKSASPVHAPRCTIARSAAEFLSRPSWDERAFGLTRQRCVDALPRDRRSGHRRSVPRSSAAGSAPPFKETPHPGEPERLLAIASEHAKPRRRESSRRLKRFWDLARHERTDKSSPEHLQQPVVRNRCWPPFPGGDPTQQVEYSRFLIDRTWEAERCRNRSPGRGRAERLAGPHCSCRIQPYQRYQGDTDVPSPIFRQFQSNNP
jgi:hypothetical protein